MTLQQFEYTLSVYEYRNFSRAAEKCNVTQPTLSIMIHKLEEELGVKIFIRSSHPIQTTVIGEKIIAQAKVVMQDINVIKDIVEEEKQSCTAEFKLAILPTIAPYLVPRFFSKFTKKHCDSQVKIIEMQTQSVFQALHDCKIDAAIIADQPNEPGLRSKILFYEEFYGYVSKNEKIYEQDVIRSSEIKDERLWLLDEGHCFRDQLMKFCKLERANMNKEIYRLGSLETFMRMVESGNGITFVPELSVHQFYESQKDLVRPFAIPKPTREIVWITRDDYIRISLEDALTKTIQNSIPKEMLKLKASQRKV